MTEMSFTKIIKAIRSLLLKCCNALISLFPYLINKVYFEEHSLKRSVTRYVEM